MSKNLARKATTGFLALVLTTGAGVGLAATASATPVTGGTVAASSMKSLVVSSPDGFANIRRGPSASAKIVGRLNNGAKVTVYETKGGWSRIGDCQWVASWLLTSKGQSGCKDKCTTPPKDPCKTHGDKCPGHSASKQMCRVFVTPRCNTKHDAEKLAAKVGGFVVNRDGTWTVQAGAFEVRANADNLAGKLGGWVECSKS